MSAIYFEYFSIFSDCDLQNTQLRKMTFRKQNPVTLTLRILNLQIATLITHYLVALIFRIQNTAVPLAIIILNILIMTLRINNSDIVPFKMAQ